MNYGVDNDDIRPYFEISLSCIVLMFNVIEISIILRIKRGKTIYEKLLISLSVADGLFGLTNGLQKVVKLYVSGELRQAIAEISSVIYFFFILSSLQHLLFISLDRLCAIRSPLRHRVEVTNKRIHIVIGSLWMLTTLLTLATFVDAFLKNSIEYRRRAFSLDIRCLFSNFKCCRYV